MSADVEATSNVIELHRGFEPPPRLADGGFIFRLSVDLRRAELDVDATEPATLEHADAMVAADEARAVWRKAVDSRL